MALRFRLGPRSALAEGALTAFEVKGVTWPVLAGVIDGELVATAGVCPHEDVHLAGGYIEDGCLTCPGHGYTFDLRTGACLHDASLVLRRYRLTDENGEIWVELI